MKTKIFKDKNVLCVGLPPGQSKQQSLIDWEEKGAIVTILQFEGEKQVVPHNFCLIPVSWNNLFTDIRNLDQSSYDCAITLDELHVERVSIVGQYLNLRHDPLPPEIAKACRDKREMKQRFQFNGVLCAPFALWSNLDDLEKAVQQLSLQGKDFILKPALGAASAGVIHATSSDLLEDTASKFFDLCKEGAKKSGYERILEPPHIIEKYISHYGTALELAIEGYVSNGKPTILMVSEKIDMAKSDYFPENKYSLRD